MIKKSIIYRTINGEQVPYLIRRTLFTCRWFSLKLHQFLLSDDACLHDHPWPFYTFLLKGGYVEYHREFSQVGNEVIEELITNHRCYPKGELTSKVYGRFSLLYRSARYAHRIEVHQPVWTMVLTLKKKRTWGFFTKEGWVRWDHHDYDKNKCE